MIKNIFQIFECLPWFLTQNMAFKRLAMNFKISKKFFFFPWGFLPNIDVAAYLVAGWRWKNF